MTWLCSAAARVALASSMATYTFRAFLALTDVGLRHPAMTPAVPVLRAMLLRASLVRRHPAVPLAMWRSTLFCIPFPFAFMILATAVAHRTVRRASASRIPVAILAALLQCSLPPVDACLAAFVTALRGFSALIVVLFAWAASVTSGS